MTACKCMVSGSISLPFRGSFRLSLTVLVHYRSLVIFSLARWSGRIQSSFHEQRPTQVPHTSSHMSLTGLSPSVALLPSNFCYVSASTIAALQPQGINSLVWAVPLPLAATQGIDFSFYSSRYLDVSVPSVPFSFEIPSCEGGFPHSEILASMLVSSSTRLIAGNHVLHRFQCQGIHHAPLLS